MSPGAHSAPASSPGLASAAWHSLLWLVIGNAIGCMVALLLLMPAWNAWLGEWTYGRWIMVHMNVMLYGWSSLPLVGFLLVVYGADRGPLAPWCRPVLWAWSAALGVGALTWLSGQSSGKLFLDWSGYARVLFPLAIGAVWALLAAAFVRVRAADSHASRAARAAKLLGLALLLAVPFTIYIASSPGLYPPINPDTGGPTAASQLESSLMAVAILLMLPFGLTQQKPQRRHVIPYAWLALGAESLLCVAMGRADVSHHSPAQFLSLGCLLVWVPLTPAYYAAFAWNANTRGWRKAMLAWWVLLLVSGWVMFLPGVLDNFKFTDGLVGHSFVAMAGFTSALLIFVLVQLMGEDGWIFTRSWSFHLWNWSVLGYVALMMLAGWLEGNDPAFTIVPGVARNALYTLRLMSGIMMLVASLEWFAAATEVLRQQQAAQQFAVREKTA